MSYWKTKVLPKIKKFLDKGNKKGASVFTKKFDTQKEAFGKDIEDKKEEFQPKVVEIYKNSPPETQAVLKDPTEDSLKAKPDAVQALLVELGKAGVPGAQLLSEATAKFGVTALPEPVLFVLAKVSPFVVDEPAPVLPEPEATPAAETVEVASKEIEVAATPPADTSAEPSSASKEVEAPAPTTTEPATPAVEEKKSEAQTSAPAPEAAPAAVAPADAPAAPAPAATEAVAPAATPTDSNPPPSSGITAPAPSS